MSTNTDQFKKADPLEQVFTIFGDDAAICVRSLNDPAIAKPLRMGKTGESCGEVVCLKVTKSTNLRAILFQSESALKTFCRESGIQSVVTIWPGPTKLTLWLRLLHGFSRNLNLNDAYFLADGYVPLIVPEVGLVTYGETRTVLESDFDDLAFPESVRDAVITDRCEGLYGARYLRSPSGRKRLNVVFWAHYLSAALRLNFHCQQNHFYLLREGKRVQVPREALLGILTDTLSNCRKDDPLFPLDEIKMTRLNEIIAQMKFVSAKHLVDETHGLNEFVKAKVRPGGKLGVTVHELYAAYRNYCREHLADAYAFSSFKKLITREIANQFGAGKSHDLKRSKHGVTTQLRGFRGVFLIDSFDSQLHQAQVESDATDANPTNLPDDTGATDAPDASVCSS